MTNIADIKAEIVRAAPNAPIGDVWISAVGATHTSLRARFGSGDDALMHCCTMRGSALSEAQMMPAARAMGQWAALRFGRG